LTTVGLGTFPFSNVFGRVTADEADAIVHRYLELGGDYIQTAPYYEGVDDLMGQILSGISRSEYLIGTLSVKNRNSEIAGSREAILEQCDDSLTRLGTDYLDYYLTSTPDGSDVPLGESIAAMHELREAGKVRHVGVCNATLEELRAYQEGGPVEILQNRLSLVDQEDDREVREFAVANGIDLIPYNVIEWGLLTSKILAEFTLREGDIRPAVLPVFRPEAVELLRAWVLERLLPIAMARDTTVEAVAIGWAISQPGIRFTPVGATKLTQIESSLAAEGLKSDHAFLADVGVAYDALAADVEETHGISLNEFLRNSFGRW
jgi:aryl-alcohol dehydrogenase-like predicted oxidoreductase